MKLLWLGIVLLLPFATYGQDGYLFFSVAETDRDTGAQAVWQMGCTINEESFPVQYLAGTEWLYVQIPKNLLGKPASLSISRQSGNMSEVMQMSFKTAAENNFQGCYRCLISRLVFHRANLVIDTPTQEASWKLLPQKSIQLNGEEVNLTDISLLQPFALGM